MDSQAVSGATFCACIRPSKTIVYLRKHYTAVIGSKCDNAQFMLWSPGLS